jgi:hypothetical protein
MNYDDLKDEIKSIAEIANGVPEKFRERCFELLIQHLLDSSQPKKLGKGSDGSPNKEELEKPDDSKREDGSSIPTPSQVKVFMQKTGVTVEDLRRVVMFEDGEVHFVQEPTTQKIARGQIEWSLLLALKSGIESNSFSVDAETVRSICQEKGFYDKANFSKHFKAPGNSILFQGTIEPQGEAQKLSGDGQKELGKLIKTLASAGS